MTGDSGSDLLEVRQLSLSYGGIVGISDFHLTLPRGGVIALLGPNGSGKSSALRGISGEGTVSGTVIFDGRDVSRWSPHRRARAGLLQVPQGGGLFREMSTAENLALGGYGRSAGERAAALDKVHERFPALAAKAKTSVGLLSGGEQQMVALGRALMASPQLLLLDEPTIGLAPIAVTTTFDHIAALADSGLSLIIVDQNAVQALRIATHVCVVSRGRIVYTAPKEQALEELDVVDAHLGLITSRLADNS